MNNERSGPQTYEEPVCYKSNIRTAWIFLLENEHHCHNPCQEQQQVVTSTPPPPHTHIFPFCPIILCTSVSYYCDCIKGGAWGLILLWPCPVWEECVRAWMLVQQKNYRIGTWLSSALWPQQSTTVVSSQRCKNLSMQHKNGPPKSQLVPSQLVPFHLFAIAFQLTEKCLPWFSLEVSAAFYCITECII